MTSQITSPMIVYLTVYSGANIKAPRHWPLWGNSPVTGEFPSQRASNEKMCPCDDVIMLCRSVSTNNPSSIVDFCARIRCLSQGEVITSQGYCVVWLLVPYLDTCFWHTNTPLEFTSPCKLILWANPLRMISQSSGSRVACSAISHYKW